MRDPICLYVVAVVVVVGGTTAREILCVRGRERHTDQPTNSGI